MWEYSPRSFSVESQNNMGLIKEYVPVWLLLVITGAMLGLAAYYLIKGALAVRRLRCRHIEIETEIKEIQASPYSSNNRLKKRVFLISEYSVFGRTVRGMNYVGGKDIYEGDYSVGDDIVIHVDPEVPERFLLKEQDDANAGGLAGGIAVAAVGALIIALGVLLLVTGHGGPVG